MSRELINNYAEYFANLGSIGNIHLEWMMDEYWKLISISSLRPSHDLIYKTLVECNATEDNAIEHHNGKLFYIPVENKKVWVMTNQSIDYIFISYNNEFEDEFHIRRIYRQWEEKSWRKESDYISNMNAAIASASELMEYADDHHKYSSRPSLDLYKSINFEMNYKASSKKNTQVYGDHRDGGYVLSMYDRFTFEKNVRYKLEGTINSYSDLKLLATCYIPAALCELNLNID